MKFSSILNLKNVLILILGTLTFLAIYYLFQDILSHYDTILPIYELDGNYPDYYIWKEDNAQPIECNPLQTGDERHPRVLQINRESGPGHAGLGFAQDKKLTLNDSLLLYLKNIDDSPADFALSIIEQETESNIFPEDWNILIHLEGNEWQEIRLPIRDFQLNTNFYPKGQPGNRILDVGDVKNFTFTLFINTEIHFLLEKVSVNKKIIAWDHIFLILILLSWCVLLIAASRKNALSDPPFVSQTVKFSIYITVFLYYFLHLHRADPESHFMGSILCLSILSGIEILLYVYSNNRVFYDLALIMDSPAVAAFTFWNYLEPSFFPYLYVAGLLPLFVSTKMKGFIFSAFYISAFLFMLYWKQDAIHFIQAAAPSLLFLIGFLVLMEYQNKKKAEAGFLSLQREHSELILQRDQLIGFVEVSFEDILDGVAFLIPIKNTDSDVVDFQFKRINKYGLTLLNLDPERISQLELNKVFSTTDYSSMFDRVMKVWMNGTSQEIQGIKVRNNDQLSLKLKIFKVNDFISIVFYDDSERMLLMEERNVLQNQLRQSQKLEAIGILAGGVAHDFNNLLTGIIGYSDLLLRKLPANDPLIKYVKQINNIGREGSTLTRQLLTFSQKQIQFKRVMRIKDLVANFEGILLRLLGETIHLHLDVADEIWNIEADANLIEQVISNLAINAKDAMPDGGTLTLEIRNHKEEDLAHFPGKTLKGEYVLLAVHDQGIGMDAQVKSRIFEPFFTTKEVGKGTGLGLSTVYGIIKQSEGEIAVESRVGMGTHFYIFLPKTDLPLEGEVNPELTDIEYRGSETILLVEDEFTLLSLIGSQLETGGYKVISCADGFKALQAIREHGQSIDLLLTDIMMPKMTGKVLIDQVNAIDPSLKIVIMSGYFNHSASHENLLIEYPYLQKPFTMPSLLKTVYESLHNTKRENVNNPPSPSPR